MTRSMLTGLVLAGSVLSGSTIAGNEVTTQVGEVELCLSPPANDVPLWSFHLVYVVVSNRADSNVALLDPQLMLPGMPNVCPTAAGDWLPRAWTTIPPGERLYRSFPLSAVEAGSFELIGEHPVAVSLELDFDGDGKGDRTTFLESKYRVVGPPNEVLTLVQERGVEVDLCQADGTRIKGSRVPWWDLETEHQAAVRASIGLPAPAMSADEAKAWMGRPPLPSDPDERRRFEHALKTDPAYLRWEALRGTMGLYAGFDYAAALREIRTLAIQPRERRATETAYFQDMYGPGLDRRVELGAGDSRRIQRTVAVFLEKGKPAALDYLDALAKEELRCADRAFLEEVRAIVLAAPADLERDGVLSQRKGE